MWQRRGQSTKKLFNFERTRPFTPHWAGKTPVCTVWPGHGCDDRNRCCSGRFRPDRGALVHPEGSLDEKGRLRCRIGAGRDQPPDLCAHGRDRGGFPRFGAAGDGVIAVVRIRFWAAILVASLLPALTQAQTAEEIAAKQAALEERAQQSVSTLQALIESRVALKAEVAELSAAAETANDADKEQVLADLEARRIQLAEIEDQISVLATGIAESDFDKREPTAFDLQSELEALVQPFIVMMRNATEEARQIEATRRGLAEADWDGYAARASASATDGKIRGRGLCFYIESILGAPNETAVNVTSGVCRAGRLIALRPAISI